MTRSVREPSGRSMTTSASVTLDVCRPPLRPSDAGRAHRCRPDGTAYHPQKRLAVSAAVRGPKFHRAPVQLPDSQRNRRIGRLRGRPRTWLDNVACRRAHRHAAWAVGRRPSQVQVRHRLDVFGRAARLGTARMRSASLGRPCRTVGNRTVWHRPTFRAKEPHGIPHIPRHHSLHLVHQFATTRIPSSGGEVTSSELTRSAWVHSTPCGPPGSSTNWTFLIILACRLDVASGGRMRSASPCRMSVGTLFFGRFLRKSSIQQSTHATVPMRRRRRQRSSCLRARARSRASRRHVVVVEVPQELHEEGGTVPRIAALMSSKTLASTPSGLSGALTRYGPSVPISTAFRTRLVPYFAMYLVTSPDPIENPTSATFLRLSFLSSLSRSAANVS